MPKRKLSNVSQRKDGIFEARQTFGYKSDGKPIRKSFYGKTANEALKKLEDYAKQVDNGLSLDSRSLTFGQWLDIWLREYKLQNLRPTTYDTYENLIKVRIIPELGKHPLLKLRPDQLQTFINNLRKEDGSPLSTSTVRQIKVIISSALQQAVKNGHITRNPADALSLPKLSKKTVRAFTREEQSALLEAVRHHRLNALFVLALGTGARIGEILSATWKNVDFEMSEINITTSISRTKDRNSTGEAIGSSRKVDETKTRAGKRAIPLTKEVRAALIRHKQEQEIEREKACSAWVDNDLIFCTQLGGHLEYRNTVRLYENFRNSAELPALSFHSLRHSFATSAISAGVDYYYLSRIMGHNSISITLDTYTDFMPDKSRSEMVKMEGILLLETA
ncbi:MAG: site-specific integrase [Defluviitaleaceae bacterium]|nr:site-specific integrase [Defluviitaleaceae bacterium]